MFRIFCTLALFSIAPFCRSGELTTKQLIAGVNQARNQIKTGEMRLLITFDYEAKKSPEEIQVWIQEQREEILREYPSPHQKISDRDLSTIFLLKQSGMINAKSVKNRTSPSKFLTQILCIIRGFFNTR